jgi:hypothetical protein
MPVRGRGHRLSKTRDLTTACPLQRVTHHWSVRCPRSRNSRKDLTSSIGASGQGRWGKCGHHWCMNALTLIGYWRSTQEPEWPDPRESVDDAWDDAERDIVASCLETGRVPWIQMGYSTCRFCGRENSCAERTDGTYRWPEGFSHFVREHGVRLPARVVDHIRERQAQITPDQVAHAWWKAVVPDWRT